MKAISVTYNHRFPTLIPHVRATLLESIFDFEDLDTKLWHSVFAPYSWKILMPRGEESIDLGGEQCPNHDETIYITSHALYIRFLKLGE